MKASEREDALYKILRGFVRLGESRVSTGAQYYELRRIGECLIGEYKDACYDGICRQIEKVVGPD